MRVTSLNGITDTVPLTVLVAYALLPSGMKATPLGSISTFTSANFLLASPATSKKVTVLLSSLATTRKASLAVSASGCDDVGPTKRFTATGGGGGGGTCPPPPPPPPPPQATSTPAPRTLSIAARAKRACVIVFFI